MNDFLPYCSRTPKFPLKAYILSLWFVSQTKPMPYYYLPIFTDFEQMISKTEFLSGQLKSEGIKLLNEILILPIRFDRLFPLKHEYWENPKVNYDEWARWDLMLRATKFFKLYKLIVTSSFYQNNTDIFTAAFPFKYNIQEEVDLFMRTSDFPVSESSNSAAIYSIEEPIGFDTFSRQIIRYDQREKRLATN